MSDFHTDIKRNKPTISLAESGTHRLQDLGIGDWGLGIGDWGLGTGDWGQILA
ncbi:hypothetical protein [Nostoc sp. UHCC 0870]|uniref:hypothetical protein n=1 Tax=Nostoc sp. UHCC 0870 TaxID=2914041 RepID=UPI0030D8B4E8